MKLRRLIATFALIASVALTARAAEPEDPLADAKVGEWVITKSEFHFGGSDLTQWIYMYVSKVEGRKITIVTQMLKDAATGADAGTPSVTDLDAKDRQVKADPATKVSDDTVEVKGKKLACRRIETSQDTPRGKVTEIRWVTNEIPVDGIARMVLKDKDGKETMVSVCMDYGATGGADKPVK